MGAVEPRPRASAKDSGFSGPAVVGGLTSATRRKNRHSESVIAGRSGGGRGGLAGLIEPSRRTGAVAPRGARSWRTTEPTRAVTPLTSSSAAGRGSPRGCRLCRRDSAADWIRRGARRQRPSSRPSRGAAPAVRQVPRDSDSDPCASSPRGSRSAGCGRSAGAGRARGRAWRTPAR